MRVGHLYVGPRWLSVNYYTGRGCLRHTQTSDATSVVMRRSVNSAAERQPHRTAKSVAPSCGLQSRDHMDAPRCTNLLAAAQRGGGHDIRFHHRCSGGLEVHAQRQWQSTLEHARTLVAPLAAVGGGPHLGISGKKVSQNRGLYTLFLARSVSRKCSCSCSCSCSQPRRRPGARKG